jgi:hypothetical protein
MSVGTTADEVSVVSDSKVLSMFVTLDGGNSAKKILRGAQIGIKYES